LGSAGPYERLDGTAYFEVDRATRSTPASSIWTGRPRTLAPRRVQFDVLHPQPTDMSRGNHKLFYGINNRGNKIEQSQRAFPVPAANSNDPLTPLMSATASSCGSATRSWTPAGRRRRSGQ